MIGQSIAIHMPDRVRALVIAHATARIPPAAGDAWLKRIAAVESDGMTTQVDGTVERWLTPEFRRCSPLTVSWVEHLIETTNPRGFCSMARIIRSLDHLAALAETDVPTLVVAGRLDEAAPLASVKALSDTIPCAKLLVLESAHLGNVEQPVEFTESVGAFLMGALT
jgi:3-oxoadipate enol-lactonase